MQARSSSLPSPERGEAVRAEATTHGHHALCLSQARAVVADVACHGIAEITRACAVIVDRTDDPREAHSARALRGILEGEQT